MRDRYLSKETHELLVEDYRQDALKMFYEFFFNETIKFMQMVLKQINFSDEEINAVTKQYQKPKSISFKQLCELRDQFEVIDKKLFDLELVATMDNDD